MSHYNTSIMYSMPNSSTTNLTYSSNSTIYIFSILGYISFTVLYWYLFNNSLYDLFLYNYIGSMPADYWPGLCNRLK